MIKLEKIKNSKSNGYFYHPENTADVGMIEAGQLVDEKLLAWY